MREGEECVDDSSRRKEKLKRFAKRIIEVQGQGQTMIRMDCHVIRSLM
jgi:hypothetical protein